ncbi:phosphoglycerate kinase [Deferribacter desulfuricans SSM1]|uniref:Phosphoglycerate kinase n=1 Tax=Deferribacter desulfuricans (strain DSM 14783 / JCM 11476 / NBRC 101012 / SSM1) TaxID=639282 RepID=D3P9F4_DEFDS|nr:phosphoglycerate kinase [Deferribacter desulfuricans]BAI81344.1 phosphoglycerate kinase [Deferribacter desulfuricans SSM1]
MVKNVKDMDFEGQKVFLRVDFNVPIKDGVIQDDTRVKEALPTVNYIKERGGKVILASHLGRPKGERKSEFSLKPVAEYLGIPFIDDCIGEKVINYVEKMESGDIVLLENLRFYKGEEKNDEVFINELRKFTDIYVNDAFGTCHRKHASVYGLPKSVDEKCAGFLIEKEVRYFEKLLKSPERPFTTIIGGAKVSDKIGVLRSLLALVDNILIGGAMAYTFLKSMGYNVGNSLVEDDYLEVANEILDKAKERGVSIYLPLDHIVSDSLDGEPEYIDNIEIPENKMGLDIGKKTILKYREVLEVSKTVLWNGPMGVFEKSQFSEGTFSIAKILAEIDATTVVGGGDSVSAVKKAGCADKIDHISTGGGASLEYIEYGSLPGIEALKS